MKQPDFLNLLHITIIVCAIVFFVSPFLYSSSFSSIIYFLEEDIEEDNDTLEVPIEIHILPDMGSIAEPTGLQISYLDNLFMEYMTSGDNLHTFPGVFIRNKGAVGQPNEITAFGLGWRNFGGLVDGRPSNEPLIGIFDFIFFPPEFIEQIEYLPPWRSFLYQRNAVGAGFNIVTQNYVAPTPYTRIRYSEGPFNYSQADVTLSQDVLKGLNIMLGLQRHFFGRAEAQQLFRGRFPNMNYRGENYRTKIRWNYSEWMNLAFTYNYTQTFTGLSGGVDIVNTPMEDIFNDLEATVRDPDARHRYYRNDMSLTAGLQLLPDTLDTGNVTLFYSSILRRYHWDDRSVTQDTIGMRTSYRSSITGGNARQWFTVGPVRFHAGANWQDNVVAESENITHELTNREYGFFAQSIFQPFPLLSINLMIREDILRRSNYTSYGGDVTLRIYDFLSISTGGVHSYRHPTLQELYWQDTTIVREFFLLPETHEFLFAEIRVAPMQNFYFSAGGVLRGIDDPIYYIPGKVSRIFPDISIEQGNSSEILTVYIRSQYSIGPVTIRGYFTAHKIKEEGVTRKHLPPLDLAGEIIYRGLLFNGNLDLQVKLEARYFDEQYGMEFNPETYFTTPQHLARIGPSGILNGSIVGKIGNAHIHITYQNITSTEYMLTPFYPMYESFLRFGITWEFLN